MQRRSFFGKLFGAVLAGFAAPRLGASVAEPIAVIDPASPWYAARQLAKFKPPSPPVYHYYSLKEDRFYRVEVPLSYRPRYYEVAVPEITIDSD